MQGEIEPNCPNPTLLLDQSPVHSAAGACKVRPASCGEWPEHAQVKLRAVVVLLQLFGQNDKAFVGRPFGRESPRPAAPQTATKLVTTIAGALRFFFFFFFFFVWGIARSMLTYLKRNKPQNKKAEESQAQVQGRLAWEGRLLSASSQPLPCCSGLQPQARHSQAELLWSLPSFSMPRPQPQQHRPWRRSHAAQPLR